MTSDPRKPKPTSMSDQPTVDLTLPRLQVPTGDDFDASQPSTDLVQKVRTEQVDRVSKTSEVFADRTLSRNDDSPTHVDGPQLRTVAQCAARLVRERQRILVAAEALESGLVDADAARRHAQLLRDIAALIDALADAQ